MMPDLLTTRLHLRPFLEEDLPSMFALYSDPAVMHFLPQYPFASMQATKEYLHEVIFRHYQQQDAYYYALVRRTDNAWLGFIKVSNLGDSNDLGYALRQDFWRQGYLVEAGLALLAHLKTTPLPFLTATHDILNPASGRVMQKLGMRYHYSYQEHLPIKQQEVVFRLYQYNLQEDMPVYRTYADRFDSFVESF
ncbi:GNAT family N-acetyltransferase [Entomospira culicis]|uniref:GNAT family N-acetyltransferase n=1 Tax=Entomospira culicis TaxID=2719989 RepID=A0A968GHX6_9SPIO|nr:GNAT family N-acetyltransferase [Entomospira culicis]NIZ19133.1 GNAT family N-acetyltransferase [Entomospira culicis]NIZ69347.1 GNAT family N-acetyltransferase [Entomospira culicis]WDI37933.1 GNAT family N-acetyltransferase [Entomospira culicis]WDI39560.1 GNAT family N-acetyltransferase [Entomospira culicis]